jgi:hypothetical protein
MVVMVAQSCLGDEAVRISGASDSGLGQKAVRGVGAVNQMQSLDHHLFL